MTSCPPRTPARGRKPREARARMYCRGPGHDGPPCARCRALLEYATRRLERCVFGDAKPTCANCVVHCYGADMREQVRLGMKRGAPRMKLSHPILSLFPL